MSNFLWWRSWHGAPTDHKWQVIAARSGVKVGVVSAVAWALFDYASQQEERGSVTGFDTELYAVYSGFDETEIVAAIKAMVDKGVIVDGKLTAWEKRQPKREDDSRERVREWRAKKRSVTQGNAPEEEGDTDIDKDTDTDTDKDEEGDTAPASFEVIQATLEGCGILVADEGAINAVVELVNARATVKDVREGVAWKSKNNGGKPIKYATQIVGPTKTAISKRLQFGNAGKTRREERPVEIVLPGGEVVKA